MIRILLSARLGERRLTQADLARMTGIRAATINEYYNELTSKISLDHFDLICEALDCDLSDLLVLEPNEEPRLETHVSVPPRAEIGNPRQCATAAQIEMSHIPLPGCFMRPGFFVCPQFHRWTDR